VKAYEASAITFGEAKERSMEARNFLTTTSITSTHTRNENKWDANSLVMAKSLAKSVFSIKTSTSKVTEDDMEQSKDKDSEYESKKASKGQVTLKGMEMLCRGGSKAMSSNTGEEDKHMAGRESKDDESGSMEENKLKDSEGDLRREGAALTARMEEVLLDLKDTD
jgi:hypothetical protein